MKILEKSKREIQNWYYSKKDRAEIEKAEKKYLDYNMMYDVGNLHHVWGVKSHDDLSGSDCNIHTLNDIEILYDRKTELYSLAVETAFMFDDRIQGECRYLLMLLDCFEQYMDSNNFSKDFDYCLFMNDWGLNKKCKSIEELYFNFKCYVIGLCTVRGYEK